MKETTRRANAHDNVLVIVIPAETPKAQLEAIAIQHFLATDRTYLSFQDGRANVLARYVKEN